MRTVEKTVYALGDLSERAQERAHSNWAEHDDYSWSGEAIGTLKKFAELHGITIRDWEFGYRAAPVRFDSNVSEDVAEFTGFRLAKWIWNNWKHELYVGKYYSKTISTSPFKYVSRRSRIQLEPAMPTGYCLDCNIRDAIYAFLAKPDNRNLDELLSECFHDWQKAIEDDMEYQSSFECFKESCKANGYEFDEDGNMV